MEIDENKKRNPRERKHWKIKENPGSSTTTPGYTPTLPIKALTESKIMIGHESLKKEEKINASLNPYSNPVSLLPRGKQSKGIAHKHHRPLESRICAMLQSIEGAS